MDISTPDIPSAVAGVAAALSHPQPMRRGSLYERRMRCGQATCACQHDPKAAHGPYFSLTRAVEGKTHSRFLTPEQAALARRQIDAGHQFRAKIEALWQGCEAWADSQLQGSTAASMAKAEKGGSKRTSKRRSSRKSRRS